MPSPSQSLDKPDIKLVRALQADFKALYQPGYTANHRTKQMIINMELSIMQFPNLEKYINKQASQRQITKSLGIEL